MNTEQIALICYSGIAALICAGVAALELLDRYSHAAKWTIVLRSRPAYLFLTINLVVGMMAILAANSTKVLDFQLAQGFSVSGFFKSLLVGFSALAFLRSSFVSLKGENGDGDFGPVALLDKFKLMLDKKIDLEQKIAMDKEIAVIMTDVDPIKARYELPTLCLTGLNNCTEQDVLDMRETINKLFIAEAIAIRSLLIGHALYKFCGIEVLRSSVEVLGDKIKINNSDAADILQIDTVTTQLNEQLIRLKASTQ